MENKIGSIIIVNGQTVRVEEWGYKKNIKIIPHWCLKK